MKITPLQVNYLSYPIVLSVFFTFSALGQQMSPEFSLTDLGAYSYLPSLKMNNRGDVVINYGPNGYSYTKLYINGTLYAPPKLQPMAIIFDINDSGQMVGGRRDNILDNWQPFLYADDQIISLNSPSKSQTVFAKCINNMGEIIIDANGGYGYTTFFYNNGNLLKIGNVNTSDFNDQGQLVGYSYLYQNGDWMDLGTLGGSYCSIMAINNSGQAVGVSRTAEDINHAFLWGNGEMQDLGSVIHGGFSRAFGINDEAIIVGDYGVTDNNAFIWEKTRGMLDLTNLLNASGSGWKLEVASCINNNMQIVGYGQAPDGQRHVFLLNPVPEPSALFLLLGGIGLLRRRLK